MGCLGGLASADYGVANPGTFRTGGQLKRSSEATLEAGVMLGSSFASFVKNVRIASFPPLSPIKEQLFVLGPLTESHMEKLIEALRSGAYRIDASRAAGIHYNTLMAWEKKGEDEQSGENVEFLDALRKAEAEAVITNVEVITRAAQDGDWKAAAWFLEHKYPDKWAMLVMLLIYYLRPLTFVKKKAGPRLQKRMFNVLNDLRKCLCCVERSCVSLHIRKYCSKVFTAKEESNLLLRFIENLTTSCDLVVVSRFHIRRFQHSSLNWNYTATLR